MGVEKIGLETDDSARSPHFSKNYPDEQQKTPPNQLMVRRRRLLELIIPFHYLREVGPVLYLKGPYVTNGWPEPIYFLQRIYGRKQISHIIFVGKIHTTLSVEEIMVTKNDLYSSFACTKHLIMSVTMWQKSHKSFQIFQNIFVWFVPIWMISRRRRLNITVFAYLRKSR